ncbi:MAG: Gfo/Idh/MocA family protein [Marinibacterium sp.]
MRIGVIGAGKIGKLRVQTIKDDPGTELVAVVDLSQDLVDKAIEGTSAKGFTDVDEFFKADMDAVVVSTPPHLHEEACVRAFEKGCHVLCEKPMSNTVEAAQRMVDAAKAADKVFAVGFNLRYYPFVKFVREAVDAGKIGKIDHIRVFGGHNGLHNFSAPWQYKMPESGGGAMMDIGIHMTDLARYFLGEITSVYGVMSEDVWKVAGSEDNAMAIFKNPEGLTATYQTLWTEWKGYKSYVEIYGHNGMVRGAYAPMHNMLIEKGAPDGAPKKTQKFYPEIIIREKVKSWEATCEMSFAEELVDFQKMVAGKYDVPLADGHAGLRSLECAAAVRESTQTGQAVSLANIGNMKG